MKIPGTNIEISRNTAPPQPPHVEANSNSYQDSVAGKLASQYQTKVSVNGHATTRGYDQETIEEIYQGYIFGAIKKTRNQVAKILTNSVEVYDPTQGNPDDAPSLAERHPYMDAIDNAPMDNSLFYAGIASYIIVLGEAFIDAGLRTMQYGNLKPTEAFELLQSNRVTRTYDDDGELKTYKLVEKLPNGLDRPKHYVPTNIIPIIDLNPWDLRKGYGMIRPIVDKVALENMATKLQTAVLANGIKAPGVLSSKEKLEKDDYEDLKNQVDTRYTSNDMDKAGTPIVTNGGFLDYKSLLEDLDKLAMTKIRGMNRDAFFAALSVSKTILGIEESGTTREVARVQREQFILDACMPIAEAILNALNQDYINNYPAAYKTKPRKMRAVAPIEKDLEQEKTEAEINKQKAETFKVYVEAGMDPQQAAKKAGIELEKGETIKIIERPANNKIELTADQLSQITRRNDAGAPVLNVDNSSHVHQHSPGDLGQTAKNQLTEKELTKIQKAEDKMRESVRQLDTALGEQYVQQVNNLEAEEMAAYIASLTEVLITYYAVALPIFGNNRAKLTAADFSVEPHQFIYNEAVRTIIEERLAKVANGHFQTINEQLTKIINDGTRDAIPRDQIIRTVKDHVENRVATWEVERLVQTEVSNAYNQATFLSDKQFITENGYTGRAYKVWRTNSPKPCPFCIASEGTRVPFDDNFYNVGEVAEGMETKADGRAKQVFFPVRFVDVNAGGLHPNCHCDYRLEIAS